MTARTISVCKFVGTISLGLLTGLSTTLSTLSLPALLSLPTATHAHTSYSFLSTKSSELSAYLRHITAFSLFSAYLLSPRRFRHPYLLYTSVLAWGAAPVVDLVFRVGVKEEVREEGNEEQNGEVVRKAVERRRSAEGWKAGVVGLAFAVQVIGLWGDGA